MSWLDIKEVLPPEAIKEMLNTHVIHDIKYYPKPRDETSCTAIFMEVSKRKEIVPTVIEVQEYLPFRSNVNGIAIIEKLIRCRDRRIFSEKELDKLRVVFKLLGLKVC